MSSEGRQDGETSNNRFLRKFNFLLATNERDRARVFSLRHRVFCEELGFFSLDLADRLEQDAFDANSLHCLVEHRDTGLAIGCLRVVMALDSMGRASILPVEKHCRDLGVAIDLEVGELNRKSLCEISRVAIPRFFRSGGKDESLATELEKWVFSQHERQDFLMTGVALNLCATALSGISERYHVLAMIEPRFQRLLARVGLRFEQVSPTVELLGLRAAFYINQQRAEGELRQTVRPLYEALRDDLKAQYILEGGGSQIGASR
ncbi:PEP-CTERM/exosortase system-associated acyltransferase [Salinicola halophyticus]|uniref:PEP-CTERM/exosortase system-associated acyltransferase n=1 Tax=Salinicola halophyticus TaxID=1808881 RepID=UPI003F4868CD